MREYWDARARENAAWYVDTTLAYDHPDMERFFAAGREIVLEALDHGPVTPDGRSHAVEIGCGLGRLARVLAERFDHVTAVDISEVMMTRARELSPPASVDFLLGDGTSLAPIPDASTDFVLSFTVFQHLPRVAVIDGYVKEIGRVLRPGGVAAFQWNNQTGAGRWALRRWWRSILQATGLRREAYLRDAPQFLGSAQSVRGIERSLRDAGLELCGTNGTGTLFAWAWARRP
jgi:SAM-dependent methyltransferase